jgi:hypothetical protein
LRRSWRTRPDVDPIDRGLRPYLLGSNLGGIPILHNLALRSILPSIAGMNITLPPNQRKWLEAEIAAGRFASLDEGLAVAVLMDLETDDLARASFAEGDVLAGEAYPSIG